MERHVSVDEICCPSSRGEGGGRKRMGRCEKGEGKQKGGGEKGSRGGAAEGK